MSVWINSLSDSDRVQWAQLYKAYAAFQGVDLTQEALDAVWAELTSDTSPMTGLVAAETDAVLGLVHFQPFYRPLQARWNGFVNDLFVSPAARGKGIADVLMGAVERHARQSGWTEVRWSTGDDNARANAFYHRISNRTGLITYKLPVGEE